MGAFPFLVPLPNAQGSPRHVDLVGVYLAILCVSAAACLNVLSSWSVSAARIPSRHALLRVAAGMLIYVPVAERSGGIPQYRIT